MQKKPTIIICFKLTFLFINIIAFGGVPMGNKRAKDIDKTTGVSTAIGDSPYSGPKRGSK